MEIERICYRKQGRIVGGILMLCSIIFLFFAFIGPTPVSIGLFSGGISPFMAFIISFAWYASGGVGIMIALFYELLFLCAFVFPILTGIFILVNKKYFPPFIASIIYGVLTLLFIILCILIDVGSNLLDVRELGAGLGINYYPTIWMFMGLALALVPAFIVRKEIIYKPQPPTPEPIDIGTKTIFASKSNLQGIEVQVRYSDKSGSHVVKRKIYTNTPLTIGRSGNCGLVLDDPRASNLHAELSYDDLYGMVIEDQNSSNGIQVNGDTIMKHRSLKATDSVRIGDSKLSFQVLGKLDELDGETTMPAGANYHEPVHVHFSFVDESGNRRENVTLRDKVTLGRDLDCAISFNSNTVSKKHAEVCNIGGNKIAIRDNDSRNGVLVNGAQINALTELHTGDKITLGDVVVTVTF